jgi:hypothetical protein
MSITRRTFLAASGVSVIGTPLRGQSRSYTLEPEAHGHTLKDANGRVVLAYLTSKPPGLTGNSACCIHPFNTVPGSRPPISRRPITRTIAGFSLPRTTCNSRGAPRRCAATSGAGDGSRRANNGRSSIAA